MFGIEGSLPNVIVPSESRETIKPVLPSLAYFIKDLFRRNEFCQGSSLS